MKEGSLIREIETERKKIIKKRQKFWEKEIEKQLEKQIDLFFAPHYYAGPSVAFASKIQNQLGLTAAKSIILRLWKNNLYHRMDDIFNCGISMKELYKLQGTVGYFVEIMGSLYRLLRQG